MAFGLSQFYSVAVAARSFISFPTGFPLSGTVPELLWLSAARVQTFLGFLDRVRFPMTQSPPVFLF